MRHTALIAVALGCLLAYSTVTAKADSVVRREISTRLPELSFQGVTFGDALDFLRDVSGANITVNWKALEGAGITRDNPINLHLTGITLRKALEMVLTEASGGDTITYVVDQGVIEITTRELADHMMVTRVYPVEDLLLVVPDFTDAPEFSLTATQNGGGGGGGGVGQSGGGAAQQINSPFQTSGTPSTTDQPKTKAERAQDLVQLIESVISPDSWKDNGGLSTIMYYNGMLVVTAPRSIQEAVGGEYD